MFVYIEGSNGITDFFLNYYEWLNESISIIN